MAPLKGKFILYLRNNLSVFLLLFFKVELLFGSWVKDANILVRWLYSVLLCQGVEKVSEFRSRDWCLRSRKELKNKLLKIQGDKTPVCTGVGAFNDGTALSRQTQPPSPAICFKWEEGPPRGVNSTVTVGTSQERFFLFIFKTFYFIF